ncbi:MAG TPA: hypothetical protein VNI01_08820 [Elusimicrobiota bacterium]|jgi:hypothetical protein|nr:hypothetical protein [Elusimicrobiota bacterium]
MRELALAALVLALVILAACARRGAKSAFVPRTADVCAGPAAEYAVVDARAAGGTVSCPPFSPPSRVSLARGAGTPEVAELRRELSPYVGLGRTSRVRAWGDRYLGPELCRRRSMFELQPGEPGFLEPLAAEPSPALRRAPCSARPVSPAAEFRTDGPFGDALAGSLL